MVNTSLNKLIYELVELYRSRVKDSDRLDERLVADWIQTQRARLLKQKFDRQISAIDESFVQDLGQVTTEAVSAINTTVDLLLNKNMLRTSIEIPKTIEGKDGLPTFTRIGPADHLSERFNIVTYDRALYSGYGRFNRDQIYAFVLGDRVYLISKSGVHLKLRYIDIRGVFQNPILAARIKTPTWTFDDDYPISQSMVDDMKKLIIMEKFPLTLQRLEDRSDDLEDNVTGNLLKQNAKIQTGGGTE